MLYLYMQRSRRRRRHMQVNNAHAVLNNVPQPVWTKHAFCKLPKICPPPFCTLLCGKSGEGMFAQIFNSSHPYALSLRKSKPLLRLSERMAALLNIYYRKSVVLLLILSQWGTKATCIAIGDDLCKNLEGKKRGGCLIEGGVFSGTYGTLTRCCPQIVVALG